jgi:hypothetical protein
MKQLFLLIALLLAALSVACGIQDPGQRGVDDDDSASAGDDDTSSDDDDDATTGGKPDDDDTNHGDDDDTNHGDDDDTNHGDDDTTVDPGLAFVDVTYCLDWDSVTFQSPPGLVDILAGFGVSLTDFPLLMSPTAVSIAVNEILMVMAAATAGTCHQDTSVSTYDLTSSQAGTYIAPHFSVGPSDIAMNTPIGNLAVYETVFEGDFTGNASQVVHGTISGRMDVTAYSGLCGAATGWTCTACPSGTGLCVDLLADGAIWDDNGLGPLMIIP